jgi:hypothetical protein
VFILALDINSERLILYNYKLADKMYKAITLTVLAAAQIAFSSVSPLLLAVGFSVLD